MFNNMKTKKGATLVGALVAITILSTTFIVLLNLQVSIIRTKFFLQYDNTANLLATEGIEIVRAIYYKDQNTTLIEGKYYIDYNSKLLEEATPPLDECTNSNVNNICALDTSTEGYYVLKNTGKVFHRFITINSSNGIPKVTSTVVVKNPKGGNLRVYKVTAELYKIN